MAASHDRLFGKQQESLALEHYLPILTQRGRAIRYARPVQKAVPAEFIDWLDSKELKAKQLTELLWQCVEQGYAAVMAGVPTQNTAAPVADPVTVPNVDLAVYDSLYREGAAS